MRSMRNTLVAGIAAIGVAGIAGTASAQSPQIHVLTVPLPGGGVEQIHYTGDVAPQVTVTTSPAAATEAATLAPMPALFGPGSTFAAMQRISVEMDREAAAMLRRAAALAAQPWPAPGQLSEAALRETPPGSASYSFVSTMSGSGVCSESVEITSPANGGRPRIVTHRSGDCGPATGAAGGTIGLPAAPAPAARPAPVWVKNDGARPYAGLVREADWQH